MRVIVSSADCHLDIMVVELSVIQKLATDWSISSTPLYSESCTIDVTSFRITVMIQYYYFKTLRENLVLLL